MTRTDIQIEIKGDMDQVIEASPTIRVRFDYPLTRPVVAEFTHPVAPWTRRQLIAAIGDQYRAIYAEEAASSPVPVGRVPGRNRTSGPYGIWGHDITDLILCGFSRGEDGVYDLEVES